MKTWSDFLGLSDAAILEWAGSQPWTAAMRSCRQDAAWHAEGDVWTHTGMVFEEVRRLPDYLSLDRTEQILLLGTALFHDAGKPATTRFDEESGRLRSPKHSLVGAAMARSLLRELHCPLALREHLVSLVRYHGRPPFLLDSGEPEREVIGLSTLLSNRLLYLFALADARGRRAAENGRSEEVLHFWRDTAQEQQCFDRPFAFINEHARFLFHRGELTSLHYIPHVDFTCKVTLMSGMPGAGKDTWLARERPGLPVVSLDGVRQQLDIGPTDNQGTVIQAAREECRVHLRAGRDFAFNATNVTPTTRKRWIDLFNGYGARIEAVYLEPSFEALFRQNRERDSAVPGSVMELLAEKLEPPSLAEVHEITWAVSS